MDQTVRARFYEGQYLGADDLRTLEEYPRVQSARHELGPHTWGIAVGLDLVQRTLPSGEIENRLMPGYGWDGYGRPIVVLAPSKISPQSFANFAGITPANGLLVKVWLRYSEAETQNPARGFEVCGVADQHARVAESYAIEVGEPMIASHDDVILAGAGIDPLDARRRYNAAAPALFDESVPFQEFPTDDKPRWLLPIGYVRWLKLAGEAGKFAPRVDSGALKDSDAIRQFRRYVGVVAETVYAPDGVLRLRDRSRDPDPDKTFFHPPNLANDPKNPNDLLWVEGSVRVQGDTRLAAGHLEWRNQQGLDGNTPTALRRKGDEGKAPSDEGGRRLQAIIGRSGQSSPSRFGVGPLAASADLDGNISERLTVLSNGSVGLGNESPAATLHVKTLSVIEEGGGGSANVWTNIGENAYYDGSWKRVDESKPGVNFHLSAQGDGVEFRFLRVEADGSSRRNIAALGTARSFVREGLFGVANDSPRAQLHVQSQTVIQEGADGSGTWANFGQNAFFSGSWLRADDSHAGVNVRLNADGAGKELRLTRVEKDGSVNEIAALGSQDSFVAKGRFGVGTTTPAETLDVGGRIVRRGLPLSFTFALPHGSPVLLPWGTTDDWNVFVSPNQLGAPMSIFDSPIAMIQCFVTAESTTVFRLTALYRPVGSDDLLPGIANVLLLPR